MTSLSLPRDWHRQTIYADTDGVFEYMATDTNKAWEMSLGQFLEEVVARDPGKTFIEIGGQNQTYREFYDGVLKAAAMFQGSGVEKGDRVCILSGTRLEWIRCDSAIVNTGAVCVGIYHSNLAAECAYIIEHCEATVLFVENRDQLEKVLSVRSELPELRRIVTFDDPGQTDADVMSWEAFLEQGAGIPDERLEEAARRIEPGDLASLVYTSGTTGVPKGVMLTHRNLTANAHHMIGGCRLTWRDRYLHAAPQFHIADGALAYSLTWVGGTHVFVPAFDPQRVVEALEDEAITVTLLVPTMITMCVASGVLADADLSAMRLMLYGASPMPAEVQRRAVPAFGCDFMQAYGMTEAAPIVSVLDEAAHERGLAGEEPWASRLRSAGSPVPGVRVEVRRDDGSIADPGEPGEIWIQGPNIMKGYWNRLEETEHALVDGWYRSGDVAFADEGGFLYIVDRAKDMIISGGENVYPAEIENVILAHPKVSEVAVIGQASAKWGESPLAIVVKGDESLQEEEVLSYCNGKLARFKLPKAVRFIDEIPRNPTGKVLKRVLRERYPEPAAD